jgi:predicted N-acetyltransferase YhbS
MHSHPNLDETCLDRIGIWEDGGNIVGVAHYESVLGEAFFELHPAYFSLKPEMLSYAESHLANSQRVLRVFINDFDLEFENLARSRGYVREPDEDRPMSALAISQPFPAICLPPGFRLQSLAEENDLDKINRVLWRGFNHSGEPPVNGTEDRKKMQSGPHFRKDLTLVVAAPGGEYVSFCGTWYEAGHHFAYIEPVATDPDYRCLGLGKAAVLEGIRRCAELGAVTAFVSSDQVFYQKLGFKKIFTSACWIHRL